MRLTTSVTAFRDNALVAVQGLQLPGICGEVLGLDCSKVDQRPDQATCDIANHGVGLEQMTKDKGLEANAAGDEQLRKEVDPGDLHVEPGSHQVPLSLADIGSVQK